MRIEDEDLSALIRQHATRHQAPDALRASVRTQAALADAGRSTPAATARLTRRRGTGFGWRAAAVGFVVGLACAFVLLPLAPRLDLNGPPEAELVAAHVQALQRGPIAEVASSDRHTVKPWFQGRLDYAPPVFDFAAEGFPLAGGRVSQVRGDAVAALAYLRNRHVIDVFVWPSAAPRAPASVVRRGFNVVHWADASMQYWVVGDLDRIEMERFAQLWRERAAAP